MGGKNNFKKIYDGWHSTQKLLSIRVEQRGDGQLHARSIGKYVVTFGTNGHLQNLTTEL